MTSMVSEESQRDPSRIPSVQEKMQLTYDVFRLSNAEMAVLLEMVQKECSAAIAHAIHADEVFLNCRMYIHIHTLWINVFMYVCINIRILF